MRDHFMPDHCHFTYHLAYHTETSTGEGEAGMTVAEVQRVRAMDGSEFAKWKREKAIAWGMPEDAIIDRFWFAG